MRIGYGTTGERAIREMQIIGVVDARVGGAALCERARD
ncbi:hypothetical protein BURMUCGD2M_6595 [Burkholderia multivorans CGD2M]|uniref:Uncharacterized protein n=1 Tax=Burkholderia multivorans CGD2 TaxID=513052 RepID=B9BPI4_9BURK|nr:hypothetical protein BURMUCGD2_6605 [Burkholderia multivorans CGD2]EEE13873.1 hypothetical protein BURMUCGD2M_6595 [Burkholderia multivorans CGD2M]